MLTSTGASTARAAASADRSAASALAVAPRSSSTPGGTRTVLAEASTRPRRRRHATASAGCAAARPGAEPIGSRGRSRAPSWRRRGSDPRSRRWPPRPTGPVCTASRSRGDTTTARPAAAFNAISSESGRNREQVASNRSSSARTASDRGIERRGPRRHHRGGGAERPEGGDVIGHDPPDDTWLGRDEDRGTWTGGFSWGVATAAPPFEELPLKGSSVVVASPVVGGSRWPRERCPPERSRPAAVGAVVGVEVPAAPSWPGGGRTGPRRRRWPPPRRRRASRSVD